MPWVSKKEATKLNIPKKTLQTILIPKDKYSLREAKKWLKEHSKANSYIRETTNYYRAMQTPPIIGSNYHTSTLSNGIMYVYQDY
jgi:serine protease inhibitor